MSIHSPTTNTSITLILLVENRLSKWNNKVIISVTVPFTMLLNKTDNGGLIVTIIFFPFKFYHLVIVLTFKPVITLMI